MEFGITQELDNKSNTKSNLVQDISNNLESFLKNKNYGSDIETFLIGFVAIKTKPGYED
ncbi:hypothetical protein [Chryseobacterium nematophagum]|uniref:hypothetical protein n=1 Tax=Chryseobacterium nematophagum TaxID=2305228 RepID=UPI001604DBE1|nr:hypothetical protein [Chryseobacterium nematophagum]